MLNFFSLFNKRKEGQGLSIETIVILIVLIIVLVVIVFIFSGQSKSIFESVKGFLGLARDVSNVSIGK